MRPWFWLSLVSLHIYNCNRIEVTSLNMQGSAISPQALRLQRTKSRIRSYRTLSFLFLKARRIFHGRAHQSKTSAHLLSRNPIFKWLASYVSTLSMWDAVLAGISNVHPWQIKPYRRLTFVPLNSTIHSLVLNRYNFRREDRYLPPNVENKLKGKM